MQSNGVLQAIRGLVVEGRSSRELINMGYAPGSVYRAQRQLRRRWPTTQAGRSQPTGQPPTQGNSEQAELARLRAENDILAQEAAALRDQITQLSRTLKETEQSLVAANEQAFDLRLGRHELQAHVTDLQKKVDQLQREASELRPLQVWAGHPCARCGEPMRGIVAPEVARLVTKDLAHQRCIEQREQGLSLFDFFQSPLTPAE